jgi:Domain of Unknown Function (DUF928)
MIRVSFVSTALSIVLVPGLVGHLTLSAIANTNQPASARSTHQAQNQIAGRLGFRVPGVRPSRARTPGISRGACSLDGDPIALTALVPKLNPRSEEQGLVEVESTVSPRPTFFVHIPRNQAQLVVFTLEDGTEEDGTGENMTGEQIERQPLYYTTFAPDQQAGIVGIEIPSEIPELEIGKTYHWSLRLQCDEVDRSGDILVEGWVQRVALDPALGRQIERTGVRNRPLLYARAGIWQDTLTSLAQLRFQERSDLSVSADWLSLMDSVNLEAIAQEPILNITAHPAQTPPEF